MKKLLLIAMLVLLVSFSFNVFAADSGIAPQLFLTVEQSPLAVYPPIMIYTAQLLNVPLPIASTVQLMVDFYNGPAITMPPMVKIGSVPLDPRTGKAVLNKQMTAGSYQAVAQIVYNGQTLVSNTVFYKVP